MKDLLIVYSRPAHNSYVAGQCGFLGENGISADAFLLTYDNMIFIPKRKSKSPFFFRVLSFLYNHIHNMRGTTRFRINEYLLDKAFDILSDGYRTIEFAGNYIPKVVDYAKRAKESGKRIIATRWDHYITDWHKELYEISDVINVGLPHIKENLLLAYPQFENKTVQVRNGLSQLDVLLDLMDNKTQKDVSFLEKDAHNRIILTIGYSGRAWQQHFYAIDAIANLPNEIKSRLFLIFPMTYANTDIYYNEYLRQRVKSLGIPFQIIYNKLSLRQNLSMRIISDVVINCQLNDALAASVQEHLMAGSVLIAGDWLPYKLFLDYGAYLHVIQLEQLSSTLAMVLDRLDEEKEKCKKNKQIIYKFSSWTFKGDDYLQLYKV